MAQTSDTPSGASIDRSERPGRMGLLLFLAALLVSAAVSLSFVAPERAQPLILLLLALLGMTGVFFLFAYAIGAVQFSGPGARNDITKAMADSAAEGLIVTEDDGRILYANEAYLALAGGESFADLKSVERVVVGAPEVSEAIYRLGSRRRRRAGAISAGSGSGCGRSPGPAGAWRPCGRSPT
jgi:two-component system, cell cycle sensor histidine kinase and response regulator CckA